MSMTQEQALKLLEYPIYKWSMDWDEREDGLNYTEAIEIAIAALRPVNREQVEKMWRGEWIAYLDGEHIMPERYYSCSKCGSRGHLRKKNFCDFCGAPMTDAAVNMMLKEMKELK